MGIGSTSKLVWLLMFLIVLISVFFLSQIIKLNKPVSPSFDTNRSITGYSVSGVFEKIESSKINNNEMLLYFKSDYGSKEKTGTMIVSTTTLYNYPKKGDRIIVYSKTDINKNDNFIVDKVYVYK